LGAVTAGSLYSTRRGKFDSRAVTERNGLLEGVTGRVELVHADARDLPFDPGTFDAVVSNLTIHNIAGDDGKHSRPGSVAG
jgi:hypothetical protein